MAFKLTKLEEKRRDELMGLLDVAAETLSSAVSEFNEVLEQIGVFREEIAERARQEIAAKSDRWQESPAAELADTWAGDWDSDFEPVEIDTSEYTVAFEELPTSYKKDDE